MWSLPTLKGAALLALVAPEAEPEPGSAFAIPELRVEAWAARRVGREHARMGQVRLVRPMQGAHPVLHSAM